MIFELGLYHIIRETLDLIKMHGIHGITKCLLQTRVILEKSESYYLGNKLFIDPSFQIRNTHLKIPFDPLRDSMHAVT